VTSQRAAQVAEATIARRLDSLHRALTLGREATPPKVAAVPQFPAIDESGNVRQGFATRVQIDTIIETLRARDADLADAVEWATWTGMRKGAVLGFAGMPSTTKRGRCGCRRQAGRSARRKRSRFRRDIHCARSSRGAGRGGGTGLRRPAGLGR
jgi:hypothetical protein